MQRMSWKKNNDGELMIGLVRFGNIPFLMATLFYTIMLY